MVRTRRHTQRPARTAERVLIGGLLFEGVLALAGGAMLVAAPSGALLQMPPEWLQGTPFGSYLIPGTVLALALGVLPIVSAAALWRAPSIPAMHAIERALGFDTAWLASFASGMAIMIWIVTQVAMVQMFHPMQAFIFTLGASVVLLASLPAVRNKHAKPHT